jgi:hypothetical protein
MATILRSEEREFKEDANKIDNFRIFLTFQDSKMV